jgi:hypothetical protein
MKLPIIILAISAIACSTAPHKYNGDATSRAQNIIDEAIKVHGGKVYEQSQIQFDFRGKRFTSSRAGSEFRLTRSFKDSIEGQWVEIEDVLDNGGFKRYVDGQKIVLSPKKSNSYRQSVNSVHYFNQLPFGLNDAAVIKEYLGEVVIDENSYDKIKVSFSENGGGDDFEDIFLYFINAQSKTLDFLAYEYQVNNGGIRFRKAINRRRINGIVIQDYLNYKADPNAVSLLQIEKAYGEGKLKLLSKIEKQSVQVSH